MDNINMPHDPPPVIPEPGTIPRTDNDLVDPTPAPPADPDVVDPVPMKDPLG